MSTITDNATKASRQSGRLIASDQGRILDEATRRRRLRKQLDQLEQDNFQEDPHANLQWAKNKPKFEDDSPSMDAASGLASGTPSMKRRRQDELTHAEAVCAKKRKRIRGQHFKTRFRKNFNALLDEERLQLSAKTTDHDHQQQSMDYFSIQAPASRYPARKFCAVCGLISIYTCVKCGARYCSSDCYSIHRDTRCLKWTV